MNATLKTNQEEITLELMEKEAPKTSDKPLSPMTIQSVTID